MARKAKSRTKIKPGTNKKARPAKKAKKTKKNKKTKKKATRKPAQRLTSKKKSPATRAAKKPAATTPTPPPPPEFSDFEKDILHQMGVTAEQIQRMLALGIRQPRDIAEAGTARIFAERVGLSVEVALAVIGWVRDTATIEISAADLRIER